MNTESKKPRIKTSSAKAKGRRFQNCIAETLSGITKRPFGKDEEIQGREMGQAGVDIKLYGKAKELIQFSIECKNSETFKLPEWIKQSKANEEKGRPYLLFITKNHFDKIVVMDLSTFTSLLEENLRLKGLI